MQNCFCHVLLKDIHVCEEKTFRYWEKKMKKHHYWLELREKEIELNFIKLRLNLIQNKKFEKTHATALKLFIYLSTPPTFICLSLSQLKWGIWKLIRYWLYVQFSNPDQYVFVSSFDSSPCLCYNCDSSALPEWCRFLPLVY